MATQVQRRRGTTAEHSTFTGAVGETTVDTSKDTVVVHDGSTQGGFPLLREDMSNNQTPSVDRITLSEYAEFDTSYTPTESEPQGALYWNPDERTLSLVTNGQTTEIGQKLEVECRNATGSTIARGAPVYASGTIGNSGRITVAPMIADGSIDAKFIVGVTDEQILNGEDGKVVKVGKIRKINTSAYSEGDVLYVSETSAGAWTSTKPSVPNISLPIAFVVTDSATVGEIFVRVEAIDENAFVAVGDLKDNEITIDAGTLLSGGGSFTLNQGSDQTITIDHENVTRSNSSASTSLTFGGDFNAIETVSSDATGHVTSVKTQTYTLPSPNDGTLTIQGGTLLSGSGTFTADQAGNSSVTIDHDNVTRLDISANQSLSFGGQFDAIIGVTTNPTGHVTSTEERTYTLPSPGDGTLTVQGGNALDGSGTFTANQAGNSTVTIDHADTSSQASYSGSGGNVVNNIDLDDYGHVTTIGSTNLDTRYVNVTGDTMTGDLTFDTGANIESSDYVAETTGWQITEAGDADFRSIYADALVVQAFTAEVAQALAGEDFLTKSVTLLEEDFTVPSAAPSTTGIKVKPLQGIANLSVFEQNDWLRMRVVSSAQGLTVYDVYAKVTSVGSVDIDGAQNYTVQVDYFDSGAAGEVIGAGSLVLDYGQSGDYFIERSVLNRATVGDYDKVPYDRIVQWTNTSGSGSPRAGDGATFTTISVVGNLGVYDNTYAGEFGFYSSKALLTDDILVGSLDKTGNYLSFDNTFGLTVVADTAYIETPQMLIDAQTSGDGNKKIILDSSTIVGATIDNGSGFYVKSNGDVRIGDASGNYIKFDGSDLDIVSDTFDLSTSNLVIDSASNSIALGATPPTDLTGEGFYVNGSGDFLIGDGSGQSYMKFTSSTDTLSIAASEFTLEATGLEIVSTSHISLGSATSLTAGDGIYMTDAGYIRFGEASGNNVTFDSNGLSIVTDTFDLASGGVAIKDTGVTVPTATEIDTDSPTNRTGLTSVQVINDAATVTSTAADQIVSFKFSVSRSSTGILHAYTIDVRLLRDGNVVKESTFLYSDGNVVNNVLFAKTNKSGEDYTIQIEVVSITDASASIIFTRDLKVENTPIGIDSSGIKTRVAGDEKQLLGVAAEL